MAQVHYADLGVNIAKLVTERTQVRYVLITPFW